MGPILPAGVWRRGLGEIQPIFGHLHNQVRNTFLQTAWPNSSPSRRRFLSPFPLFARRSARRGLPFGSLRLHTLSFDRRIAPRLLALRRFDHAY
jgi:hypothetical protein